jgi:hypothetical protein
MHACRRAPSTLSSELWSAVASSPRAFEPLNARSIPSLILRPCISLCIHASQHGRSLRLTTLPRTEVSIRKREGAGGADCSHVRVTSQLQAQADSASCNIFAGVRSKVHQTERDEYPASWEREPAHEGGTYTDWPRGRFDNHANEMSRAVSRHLESSEHRSSGANIQGCVHVARRGGPGEVVYVECLMLTNHARLPYRLVEGPQSASSQATSPQTPRTVHVTKCSSSSIEQGTTPLEGYRVDITPTGRRSTAKREQHHERSNPR